MAKIRNMRQDCDAISKKTVDRNVLGQHRFESFVSTISLSADALWKGGANDEEDWSEEEEEGARQQLYPDHTFFHTVEVLLHLIGEEANVEPLDPMEHQPVPVDGKRGPPYMKTMVAQKNRAGEDSCNILLGSCNKIAAFLDLVLDHHHPDIDVKSLDNYYLKQSFTGYRFLRLKVKYREEEEGWEILVHLIPFYRFFADHDYVEDFFGGGERFNNNMEHVLKTIFRRDEDEEVANMILRRDSEEKDPRFTFEEENSVFVELLKGSETVLEALGHLTGKHVLDDTMAYLAVQKQRLELAMEGDDDDMMLELLLDVGVAYQLNSMHTDAVKEIGLALDGLEAVGHERTIEAMVSLSASHLVLEQIDEAVTLLSGALETQKELTGEDSEEFKNIAELLHQAKYLSLTEEEKREYDEEQIREKKAGKGGKEEEPVFIEEEEEELRELSLINGGGEVGFGQVDSPHPSSSHGRLSPGGRLSPSSPPLSSPLSRTARATMRKENTALQEDNDTMKEEIMRLTHEIERTQKTIRGVYLWGASGGDDLTEETKIIS
ncbi:hypothetical protein TL16_g04091 [Triparma laevis f. inornata]|uniref:Uncharacterized protein n=2 Tax=Triparma laevis TaxID=1534972 RepID=A0A9W7EHY4_9STRA|nr:hypothetical protein TL16_g04091 [Triparma laevis f. inornata]GMH79593.1 hypothetical protein TrLO_g6265 [Triparma laevis f. longispina]